jgi:hypothetical protein
MRLVTISTTVGVLLTLTFVPAYAGQHGYSGSHAPKAETTHGPSSTGHGPSATNGSAKPGKAPSTHTTTKADTKLAKTDTATQPAKSKKTDSALSTTTSTSSTSTTSTTGTTSTIDFTSAPLGQKLSTNSALRSKLESRLQALGYTGTAYQAAYGFKNLGQFVAATNVSRNLGVSFDQLKLQMTGLTVKADGTVVQANLGTDGKVTMLAPANVTNAAPTKSLGQSIQTIKSGVDSTAAAHTATTQADAEIQGTSTTVH